MARRIFLLVALLLVAAVALSAYQCVTACVDEACTPPCHAHSHANACVHQTQSAILIKAPRIASPCAVLHAIPVIEGAAQSTTLAARIAEFTPPLLFRAPVVLRV